MADYTRSCSTPGCAFTGFSSHSPCCPLSVWHKVWLKGEAKRKELEAEGFEPASQDDKVVVCLYCGCLVSDVKTHRRNACP